ncbi:hypothetical protein D3C84_849810 [compost metagenome]
MLAVPFVLDAAGVTVALGTEEIVGVEHDFVKTLVPVQVTQVQQRQLRLGGEQQALFLVQLDTGQGSQVFVLQKQYAGFAQPQVFGGADAIEKTQVLAHPVPHLVGDRVLGQDAPTAPGAKGPHAVSAMRFWSSNRQGGCAPGQ